MERSTIVHMHAGQSWWPVSTRVGSSRGLRMLAVAAAVVANLAILLMSRVVKGEFP
jgi:hypothetical protein